MQKLSKYDLEEEIWIFPRAQKGSILKKSKLYASMKLHAD